MKNKIILSIAYIFVMSMLIISCSSSEEKVADARENLENTQHDQIIADNNLEQAVRDSVNEYTQYQNESEQRIETYLQEIKNIKAKIQNEKKSKKSEYEKVLLELESKTIQMKKDLKDYNTVGKDKWDTFKTKFSNDLDMLGKAISNFFN